MLKLNSFLLEAKNATDLYKHNIEEKLNICLGNVSCDMDSAIGAILLAYYLTHKNQYYSDIGNYDNFWIPVINCPKSELQARIDIAYHLKFFGIDLSKLTYIDDIDLDYYSSKGEMKLAIIDHNKLDLTQEKWKKSVCLIVDHHVDMKEHMDLKEDDRLIKFCGSACSMVINLIIDNNLEEILTGDLCKFFSAAMLIDTENFKPSLKQTKWGELDELAFNRMNRIVTMDYYKELLQKKIDRQLNIELGLELMLRKDYKNYLWKNCIAGISVVFNPMYEIMSTFGVDVLRQTLKARMEENKLNIYMIISQIYLEDGHAFRELVIYDEDTTRLNSVTKEFESNSPYPLQKKKFTGLSKNFAFYYIKDESVSRKKVEPIMKEIFEKL